MAGYRIIEQACLGKSNDALCEDGWIATPHYVAVIDGSTSKGSVSYGDKKSGLLAMELIREGLKKMPATYDVQQAANYLTDIIAVYYQQHNLFAQVTAHPENRLTASAVIYSISRQEIWHLGDCFCLIDDTFIDNPKYWEYPLAQARSLYIEKELAKGMTLEDLQQHDTGRDYIMPLLKFGTRYQNNEKEPLYGYCVIDGFPIPNAFIKVTPIQHANQIVLSSDGYMHLYPTLKESEQFNKDRLAEDPLCIHRCKMTKGLMKGNRSFDDRTYIRLKNL